MIKKPVRIEQDTKYPSMYWLIWKDGVKSENFYNLTRATEYLRNYRYYFRNMGNGTRLYDF